MERFSNLASMHLQEEEIRQRSVELIRADNLMAEDLDLVEKATALIHAFSLDGSAATEEQATLRMLGIRLFNATATALKVGLSGYYQIAFHQARDIMEIGFLLDYFRTNPGEILEWKRSDRAARRKSFDPVKIRIALDQRDGDGRKRREAEYNKLSELASHATYRGFSLTANKGQGFVGPFYEPNMLKALLRELVLRTGASAVIYAVQFGTSDQALHYFREGFQSELIAKRKTA